MSSPTHRPTIPPAGEMLRTHTLSTHITAHPIPNHPIFDPTELALLRRFVTDPSQKDEILKERDMVDEEGDAPGTRASQKYGSLTGYVIARHGTGDEAFGKEEIWSVRKWFEKEE